VTSPLLLHHALRAIAAWLEDECDVADAIIFTAAFWAAVFLFLTK
jgi:hypothetical protein